MRKDDAVMDRHGLELTQKAADQIRKVVAEQQLDLTKERLRVGVTGDGHLRRYSLDLEDVAYDDDKVFESHGIKVVCSAKDLSSLNGAIIDYQQVAGGAAGFTFDVPDQKHILKGSGDHDQPPPDVETVRQALYHVFDPEVGVNIVDLGLIYGLEVVGRDVHIRMTMTTPACPLGDQIRGDTEQSIRGRCPGVDSIQITTVWEPKWSHDKMTPEGKKQLGW
jgi:iron-sulfur cluster assembly accessory protein